MEPGQRTSHVIDEIEAASWIEDGMTIAVGSPTPMALVHQIIRRGLRDLTVIDVGLSLDMLIASGCVKKGSQLLRRWRFWRASRTRLSLCSRGRPKSKSGNVKKAYWISGLQAAAQGLPFLPWRVA